MSSGMANSSVAPLRAAFSSKDSLLAQESLTFAWSKVASTISPSLMATLASQLALNPSTDWFKLNALDSPLPGVFK